MAVVSHTPRPPRPAHLVATCCLLAALVALFAGGAALWRTLTPSSPDGLEPRQRLSNLKAAIGTDLPAPVGATLVSRTEHAGDNVSDGPAVEWEYRFDGSAPDFVEHYRRALGDRGWAEEPPGNQPGQLTNFGKWSGNVHHVIAILEPGPNPNFRVDAFG